MATHVVRVRVPPSSSTLSSPSQRLRYPLLPILYAILSFPLSTYPLLEKTHTFLKEDSLFYQPSFQSFFGTRECKHTPILRLVKIEKQKTEKTRPPIWANITTKTSLKIALFGKKVVKKDAFFEEYGSLQKQDALWWGTWVTWVNRHAFADLNQPCMYAGTRSWFRRDCRPHSPGDLRRRQSLPCV